MIKEYITGVVTNKLVKNLLIVIGFLVLVNYCNRQCRAEKVEIADNSVFDYTAIAKSLQVKDTVEVDTIRLVEDLKAVVPEEIIQFAKDHSGLFAKYIRNKYEIEYGFMIKKE